MYIKLRKTRRGNSSLHTGHGYYNRLIFFSFFSKSTRLPHQFIAFADSSLVSFIFLYGSVDCKTISFFSKSFYRNITRALEYAKIRTVLQSNGAEIGGENSEIQLIIYYTRTAIQHEGQDEKVCQLTLFV